MRAARLACGLLLVVAGVSNALPQYSGASGSQQAQGGISGGVGQPPHTPTQSAECPLNNACVPFAKCLQGVFDSVVQGRKRSVPNPPAANRQTCGQEGNICCPIPPSVLEAQQQAVAGGAAGGAGSQQQLPPAVLEECGDYEECVPSFQCTKNGTINTSGAGLLDVRIGPNKLKTCINVGYPEVPAVCCRVPGSCPRSHVCVTKGQCKSDGTVNTSGIGHIDIRIQSTCDLAGTSEKGICCLPPQPTPLITCPGHQSCQPEGQCDTKAATNADGSYVTCDLNAAYDKGVCCLPKPTPLTTCPAHHTCQPAGQCTTTIALNADGLYSTCYLGDAEGVCCERIPPLVTCPATHVCLLDGQCGTSVATNAHGYPTTCYLGDAEGVCCERIPPLVTCPATHVCLPDGQCGTSVATNAHGYSTSCYIDGAQGGQEGTCCERYAAVQKCADNFSCHPKDQCQTNFDYHPDFTEMNCFFGDGTAGGTCCENYPPVDKCPDNLLCQDERVCNSIGALNPDGSEMKCYKADGSGAVGTCCDPPISVVDACPLSSICTPKFDCLGKLLTTDGHFQSPSTNNPLSYCDLLDGTNGVCCQNSGQCGVRNLPIDTRIQGPLNEAVFAEFPWMAIIFFSNYTYKCGASLISDTQLVTGAHCVHNLNVYDIKVRLGEYQVNTNDEPLNYQDVDISKIDIHPDFNGQSLFNDIAVLTLTKPVFFHRHIDTICLPSERQQYVWKNCVATGWGKDAFNGNFQATLKKVDLPFVDHGSCTAVLRTTRLGSFFVLDKSFLCAGEKGRDACTGDGGGPLACQLEDYGPYFLAGITAWGIGCGEVPGVYADVAYLKPWLDTVVSSANQQQTSPSGQYGK